eukprot:6198714-Pleurochrysis_carterae.AAC.2
MADASETRSTRAVVFQFCCCLSWRAEAAHSEGLLSSRLLDAENVIVFYSASHTTAVMLDSYMLRLTGRLLSQFATIQATTNRIS